MPPPPYLKQEDYQGARQYIQKFTEEARQLPLSPTQPMLWSIPSFQNLQNVPAKIYKAIVEYSIIIGRGSTWKMLICADVGNILENAVEECQKVSEGQRIIRLNLIQGNFLFIKCGFPTMRIT